MKVLYIYQYFGTPKGGWSTRVYEMARRWIVEGHEVTVLTSPYDKSDFKSGKGLIKIYQVEGIQVIVINISQSNKHSILYRMLTFILFSVISIYFTLKIKYDLIIASSGPISVGIPALIAKKLRKKPMVFEVRDLWPGGAVAMGLVRNNFLIRLLFYLERTLYENAAFVACASEGMAQNIKERYDNIRVEVIPNACDIELFQGVGSPSFEYPEWAKERALFVYFGSIGLMDNCEQILNAAIELKKRGNQNIRIVLIGEGAERATLINKAREYHLQNVCFTGLIPKVQVVSWLKDCLATLIVFQPNSILDTSSPNKLFDSLAAGKPVIQTTQGWIKDLIDKKNIGLTVSPNRPVEMADALERLCQEQDLREEMGRNCLMVARNEFDRNKVSKAYLNLLLKQL